eukprot:2032663-Pyramimonas_sp.AAC.2
MIQVLRRPLRTQLPGSPALDRLPRLGVASGHLGFNLDRLSGTSLDRVSRPRGRLGSARLQPCAPPGHPPLT